MWQGEVTISQEASLGASGLGKSHLYRFIPFPGSGTKTLAFLESFRNVHWGSQVTGSSFFSACVGFCFFLEPYFWRTQADWCLCSAEGQGLWNPWGRDIDTAAVWLHRLSLWTCWGPGTYFLGTVFITLTSTEAFSSADPGGCCGQVGACVLKGLVGKVLGPVQWLPSSGVDCPFSAWVGGAFRICWSSPFPSLRKAQLGSI